MKKIKLYSIISVLITVILFSTAAICNQCGITPTTETNVTAAGESNTTETVPVITQAPEITEETTATTTATTTAATTASESETTTKPEDGERAVIVNFTFNPMSGPEGTDVQLILSAPIISSATVHFNGVVLPRQISTDGKIFTVTIPVGSSSGYFKIFYDGNSIQAAEQFTVTEPPPKLGT